MRVITEIIIAVIADVVGQSSTSRTGLLQMAKQEAKEDNKHKKDEHLARRLDETSSFFGQTMHYYRNHGYFYYTNPKSYFNWFFYT